MHPAEVGPRPRRKLGNCVDMCNDMDANSHSPSACRPAATDVHRAAAKPSCAAHLTQTLKQVNSPKQETGKPVPRERKGMAGLAEELGLGDRKM